MDLSTIPDAVEAALRAAYIANPPEGVDFDQKRIRLKNETTEIPSPRVEILTMGEAKRVPSMDSTARVNVEVRLVTSLDLMPSYHGMVAGKLEAWWRALRSARKPGPYTTFFLHDILYSPPQTGQDSDEREQWTLLRGEWIVSLYDPESLI